jgi:predicted transport protein
MSLTYAKPKLISLKGHPDFNEKWVQARLAEDPALLGLGDLTLKDQERIHAGAGRLDLLFQEAGEPRRFEVELQLGRTDESHIIRTIEYWDIEKKRYPQYDHVAVIVAEDITSRFLNVISMFNGFIPLVAIQMSAIQLNDSISLVFTKVLDQLQLGLVDEDEEVQEPADRAYWQAKGSEKTLQMTDALFAYIQELDPDISLNYNRQYIGLARDGRPNNFVSFVPQKRLLRMAFRLPKDLDLEAHLEEVELDVYLYTRWGTYDLRIAPSDVEHKLQLIKDLMKKAFDASR